jgi:hypothetical protein
MRGRTAAGPATDGKTPHKGESFPDYKTFYTGLSLRQRESTSRKPSISPFFVNFWF